MPKTFRQLWIEQEYRDGLTVWVAYYRNQSSEATEFFHWNWAPLWWVRISCRLHGWGKLPIRRDG